ncbi:Uma2 family endonuclease [Leptodesmis sp.]|uniref:Uma2 family endonuclease n=1 Tax=Leptodesmis sp. TaxID=3100501 RepID=UPI004053460A
MALQVKPVTDCWVAAPWEAYVRQIQVLVMTTLLDDLGTKRSLYEEMGVAEYWVVDVHNAQVIAYVA